MPASSLKDEASLRDSVMCKHHSDESQHSEPVVFSLIVMLTLARCVLNITGSLLLWKRCQTRDETDLERHTEDVSLT